MLFLYLVIKINDFSKTPEARHNENDVKIGFKSPVTYIQSAIPLGFSPSSPIELNKLINLKK